MINLNLNVAYGDLFDDYRILTEKDMVRKNSRDDYGLGPGWYFAVGKHIDRKWTVCYHKPKLGLVDQIENHCCDGRIGSLQLFHIKSDPPKIRLLYNDILMIAQGIVGDIYDIPEDILSLI